MTGAAHRGGLSRRGGDGLEQGRRSRGTEAAPPRLEQRTGWNRGGAWTTERWRGGAGGGGRRGAGAGGSDGERHGRAEQPDGIDLAPRWSLAKCGELGEKRGRPDLK